MSDRRRLAIVALEGPPECGDDCDHYYVTHYYDGDVENRMCVHERYASRDDINDLIGRNIGRFVFERPDWCPLLAPPVEP